MTPAGYRALLQADISQADQQVAAAFACEWPLRGSASKGVQNGEKLLLTPFFMTSGQQRWCKIICDAARASARPNPGSDNPIAEALFGPWRYVQQVSALGWDPATERHYALEAKAPTDSKPISVAAAVWLAAESLALFPSFGVGRTLRVPCFDQVGQTFFWPLWRAPLSIDAVRAMLRLPLAKSGQGGDRNEATALQRQLRMRGIAAVFASRRGASPAGHGYFVFSPSQLLWSS
jgi:hypothetical protein